MGKNINFESLPSRLNGIATIVYSFIEGIQLGTKCIEDAMEVVAGEIDSAAKEAEAIFQAAHNMGVAIKIEEAANERRTDI